MLFVLALSPYPPFTCRDDLLQLLDFLSLLIGALVLLPHIRADRLALLLLLGGVRSAHAVSEAAPGASDLKLQQVARRALEDTLLVREGLLFLLLTGEEAQGVKSAKS